VGQAFFVCHPAENCRCWLQRRGPSILFTSFLAIRFYVTFMTPRLWVFDYSTISVWLVIVLQLWNPINTLAWNLNKSIANNQAEDRDTCYFSGLRSSGPSKFIKASQCHPPLRLNVSNLSLYSWRRREEGKLSVVLKADS
jgi:hypothetical protein